MSTADISGYRYQGATLSHSHRYLLPRLFEILDGLGLPDSRRRLFELGCGNGSVANILSHRGWDVTAVDPSTEGIAQARAAYPHIKIDTGSAYDDLAARYGMFPVGLSLEVVEHIYAPRQYAATLFSLLEPDGVAIVSTPYHGYWKNLVLAITGRMDNHFTALWDHGHIKFWSERTLRALLAESGFTEITFSRVGRIAPLARSMIAIARTQ
jgi:2-polyprenyl-6-hydroxyphenyl methylase/3-demethylubiquinone-9 3-methyltransferase